APDPVFTGTADEILLSFGCSPESYKSWRRELVQTDRHRLSNWVDRFPFAPVSQLHGQMWAGVPLQNGWFPAQRAAGGGVQLLSPFLDLKMIRFGLSLPFPFKFKDGVTKAFLYDFLEAKTGLRLPKRPSPNQARIWSISPYLQDLPRMDRRLRSL